MRGAGRVTAGSSAWDEEECTCLDNLCQGSFRTRASANACAAVLAYTRRMSSPALPLPAVAAAPAASRDVRSLSGLMPFLRPYRVQIASAIVFLVLAAVSTLVFPAAMKSLIDQGFVAGDPGSRMMALREHFFALFAVGAALGVFSALRFYAVTWL